MVDLELFAVVLGDSPPSESMFPVKASGSISVGELKELVHAKGPTTLERCKPADLVLWKLNTAIHADQVDDEVVAFGQDLSAVAEKMNPAMGLSHYFTSYQPRESLHIIVQLPKPGSAGFKRKRGDDTVDPALERPSKLQATTEAPSRAAAPSKFRYLVEGSDPKLGILCNRPMDDTTIPLTLLHPVFGQFVEDCDSFKPGPEENAFARELSVMAGYFDSETARRQFFNDAFAKYYKFLLIAEEIPGTNRPTDGHAYVTDPKKIPKKQYIFVITEGKNEINNNGTDPRFQAILYYRDYARRFYRPTFQASCLPVILLTYYAANIQVSGVITHPDGTVQSTVLTATFPLDADWRDDEHWTRLARCLGALKKSFEALSTYYNNLPDPLVLLQDNYPPMNFPYPTKCGDIAFVYVDRVYPGRLIFSAKEVAPPQRSLFIKFSKEYSVDAHRLLSDSGHAPKLYGSSRPLGGWVMVVMEEMKRPWVVLREIEGEKRTQFREAIEDAIESLHTKGFVHGDIRGSNVFVCPEDPGLGIKIIDFDEAGVDGTALYPRNLNTKTVQRPAGAADGEKITKEHDRFMLEKLFVQSHSAESRSIVGPALAAN